MWDKIMSGALKLKLHLFHSRSTLNPNPNPLEAKSAEAVEYADYISAKE